MNYIDQHRLGDSDDQLEYEATFCVLGGGLLLTNQLGSLSNHRRRRQYWVCPWIRERNDHEQQNTMMKLYQELAEVARVLTYKKNDRHIQNEEKKPRYTDSTVKMNKPN